LQSKTKRAVLDPDEDDGPITTGRKSGKQLSVMVVVGLRDHVDYNVVNPRSISIRTILRKRMRQPDRSPPRGPRMEGRVGWKWMSPSRELLKG
jgi:hypothetical protein